MLRGHQRIILERVKGKSRRKVSAKHVHGDPAIPLPEKPSWQQPLSNTTAQLRVLLQKPKCHLLQGEGLPFETAATRSDSEIASVRLQITGVLARMSSAVHRPDRSLGLKVRTVGISNWPSNHRNLHTWFPYRNTRIQILFKKLIYGFPKCRSAAKPMFGTHLHNNQSMCTC